MDSTKVALVKSWDPTGLNKGVRDPTSQRQNLYTQMIILHK
jgi:hypothetical protein